RLLALFMLLFAVLAVVAAPVDSNVRRLYLILHLIWGAKLTSVFIGARDAEGEGKSRCKAESRRQAQEGRSKA
ncbi:hypothetical protein FB451DRAFT_1293172, partial [Mycena latifolia]